MLYPLSAPPQLELDCKAAPTCWCHMSLLSYDMTIEEVKKELTMTYENDCLQVVQLMNVLNIATSGDAIASKMEFKIKYL